jgi:hypothetical protein
LRLRIAERRRTILLKRIDDKTVFLQKTKNGNFSDPSEQLSYCGDDAQKTYAQQKSRKRSEIASGKSGEPKWQSRHALNAAAIVSNLRCSHRSATAASSRWCNVPSTPVGALDPASGAQIETLKNQIAAIDERLNRIAMALQAMALQG